MAIQHSFKTIIYYVTFSPVLEKRLDGYTSYSPCFFFLVSEKDLMQFTADENKLKIILFEISRKYKILPPPWPDLAVSLPLVS